MFNSTAEAVMDELAKVADGKTKIEMINYLNRVTLDVIGKVCCHPRCYCNFREIPLLTGFLMSAVADLAAG